MSALIRLDRSRPDGSGSDRRPIRFCSRCGHPAEDPPDRTPRGRFTRERVCRRCGMGMMLSCARDALPGTAGAFLIATADLRISAVSEAGERFFGEEKSLIGTPVLDLLTSPLGDNTLAHRLAEAAERATDPQVLPVRLLREGAPRVGTMAARVGTCGPPRAALLSVEPTEFGRR